MTLEGIAELSAAALALWAAYKSITRPPALDWRHLFKLSLATVLRGEVEAQDGDAAAWAALLALWVPYNPAGRSPEQKLSAPDPDDIPPPALDGERALVQRLAALPDPAARWVAMYVDNERVRDALMSDPDELGEDYNPQHALGAEASWNHIAAWGSALHERLKRRFDHVVTVSLGGTFADAMGAASALRTTALETLPEEEGALQEQLHALLPTLSDRLVLILEANSAPTALRLLRADELLRDRIIAIVSLGAALQGTDEQKAWMEKNFTQDGMSTEINRATPYFSVQLVDPRHPMSVDWDAQRWPTPKANASGRAPIERIDLGPLPVDWLGEPERREQLARALWTTLAFRL